jgi:hypothetical protein
MLCQRTNVVSIVASSLPRELMYQRTLRCSREGSRRQGQEMGTVLEQHSQCPVWKASSLPRELTYQHF